MTAPVSDNLRTREQKVHMVSNTAVGNSDTSGRRFISVPLVFLMVFVDGAASPGQDWMICALSGGRLFAGAVQIRPGEQVRFGAARNVLLVGTEEAFALEKPMRGIRWSVEPVGRGITVAADGVVSVRADAAPGAYNVVAAAKGETRKKQFQVYVPSAQPLVGAWTEVAQIECGDGQEIPPETKMAELIFRANGEFTATWFPFETRKDYWGTYEYNAASGSLSLQAAKAGNLIPQDMRPSGTAVIDANGRLVLSGGLWLGSPAKSAGSASGTSRCGHIFRR